MAWQSRRGSHFPDPVRRAALKRDRDCALRTDRCTGTSTEVDHIVPTHLGGSNDLDNARGVCHACHLLVTARQAAAARARSQARARREPPKHPGLR